MSYFRKLLTIGVVLISTTVMSFAMKAEYRFEECNSSATLKNHLGTGLDGTVSGDANVTLDDGKIKNGLTFRGDGFMSVEQDANLDLVENLTIAFWIKPAEIKKQALVTKGLGSGADRKYGGDGEYFLIMLDNGKLYYKHNGNECDTVAAFTDTAILANEWTHIVLTRDNGTKKMRFYVNGVANHEYTYTNNPVSSNSEKTIFGQCVDGCSDTYKLNGKLDEIKFYNISLTQADITSMYDSENNGTHSTGDCQPAPEAVNDTKDLPFAGTVSIDILDNDRANDSATCSVDASTVEFLALAGATLSDNNKTLTVPNEGVWSIDNNNSGVVTFVSENAFTGNPTVVTYVVSDSCGRLSNEATIALTRVAPPVVHPADPVAPADPADPVAPAVVPVAPQGTGTPVASTQTPVISSAPSISNTDNNFTIGDRVWYDTDKNGIQDSGELGVADVTVVLYDCNGSVVDRTTTNASGLYRFTNISEGCYTIGFSALPANHIFTSQNMGSSDAKDSDVDSSGRTAQFTIGNVENDLIYDAGIVSTVVASGGISSSGDINSSAGEDCNCDPYKSSIPSISRVAMVFMLILMGLLGAFFLKREELSYTKK